MDIEVTHNPLVLPSRVLLKVRSSRAAEEILHRFCETKDARGYRLRYIPDHANNTLELGGRWQYPVDMAIARLRETNQYQGVLPWVCKMIALKRAREKYSNELRIDFRAP